MNRFFSVLRFILISRYFHLCQNSSHLDVLLPLVIILMIFAHGIGISSVSAEGLRDRLEGLVFEVEEWSEPKAWDLNHGSENRWQLWTKEEDVWEKRSNGASLLTPSLGDGGEKASPEEGAPALHTHITGIPNGKYHVYSNPTNRPLAFSFDGKNWESGTHGENDFGIFVIQDGTFDVWVDDRYPSPENPGPAYYDYIRFVPTDENPGVSHLETFTLPDGNTQVTWISTVPMPRAVVKISAEAGNDGKTYAEHLTGMRNHRIFLSDLEKGKTYRAVLAVSINKKGEEIEFPFEFCAGAVPVPAATKKTFVALKISEPTAFPRQNWPVTSGIPFPKGVLASAENVRLLNAEGGEVPAQFEAFSLWNDGSVKWLCCTFRASTQKDAPTLFRLETSPDIHSQAGIPALSEAQMRDFAASIESDTAFPEGPNTHWKPAPADFCVTSRGALAATLKTVPISETPEPPRSGDVMYVSKTSEERENAKNSDIKNFASENSEAKSGVKSEVKSQAEPGAESEKDFRTGLEVTFFGDDFIRVRAALANHELKDFMTLVRSAKISLPGGNGESSQDIRIVQETESQALRVSQGEKSSSEHADGLLQTSHGTYWLRDFWQTWPKGISCTENKISFEILPQLPDGYHPDGCDELNELVQHYYWLKEGAYQFKRGMEIRSDFWIVKSDVEVRSEWLQNPLFACAEPEYYCGTGVFPPVNPVREGEFEVYETAFRKSIINLERGRQERKEYGWMNFGDWYGERKYNWGNNEYDLSYTCALFFVRTGDPAVLARGIEMARHYTTIDRKTYVWDLQDREAQYTHCYGHVNRFFTEEDPRVKELVGAMEYNGFAWESDGGGGHAFHPGSYYIACLTGDRYLWDAAFAAAERQAEYYTPSFRFSIERAAGWPLNNAVYSYNFTNDPFFLNAARLYVEKIAAQQNPKTGCFDLPQDLTECDCPDKKEHRGGKAFAVGILLHALIRFDEACPPEDPLQKQAETVIVRASDWLIDVSWNEEKKGFRYKTGCPKYENSGWFTNLVTEGIAYSGELTGNPRYLAFVTRVLTPHLIRNSGYLPGCGKEFTQIHRQLPHTLYYMQKHAHDADASDAGNDADTGGK